jgi:hypothetical protein
LLQLATSVWRAVWLQSTTPVVRFKPP